MGSDPWEALVGPTWAEVDLDAVLANLALVRSVLREECRLLAVVKANAYGHGAVEVARTVLVAGRADAVGVGTVAEGLQLRNAGIDGRILVFTPPRPVDIEPALDADLTLTVASLGDAVALAGARSIGARVHLKLDTGMGRYGLPWREVGSLVPRLMELGSQWQWEGIYTHFARGGDRVAAGRELARLLQAEEIARTSGLCFALRHSAASAAVLTLPESHLDMVRVGSLLYGHMPAGVHTNLPFRKAFTLRSTVAEVRRVAKGEEIGYGGEWRARRAAVIATLPVGFADGLDIVMGGPLRRPGVLFRALIGSLARRLGLGRLLRLGAAAGDVVVNGKSVHTIGRVGMQHVTVDCTGVPTVQEGMIAQLQVPSTAVGAHLARVFLQGGHPVRADTLVGSVLPHHEGLGGEL